MVAPGHALMRIGGYPVNGSALRKYCLTVGEDKYHRSSATMGMPTRARRSIPEATFTRSPARFASSKATPRRYPHRFLVTKP